MAGALAWTKTVGLAAILANRGNKAEEAQLWLEPRHRSTCLATLLACCVAPSHLATRPPC
eukprot:8364659-Alexandrium_andersonii.AAC.2